jgi:integrase
MHKPSTQKNRRFLLKKHLLPQFGDVAVCDITRQDIQAYVARLMRREYAPRTIDHIHDVLSAILRTAVKWGHLSENLARGVELPTLRTVMPKWALTPAQAAALIDALPVMPQAMVGLAILSGLRRGEVFALRWRDIDLVQRQLTVRESVYDGHFGTPKTEAGVRQVPLSSPALTLMSDTVGAHGLKRARVRHPDGGAAGTEQRAASAHLPRLHATGPTGAPVGSRSGGPTRPGRISRACQGKSRRN